MYHSLLPISKVVGQERFFTVGGVQYIVLKYCKGIPPSMVELIDDPLLKELESLINKEVRTYGFEVQSRPAKLNGGELYYGLGKLHDFSCEEHLWHVKKAEAYAAVRSIIPNFIYNDYKVKILF